MNNGPSETLAELLRLDGVQHDGTPIGIRDATQFAWRRQGAHSGDIPETKAHLKEQALPLFDRLGVTGAHAPVTTHADYALIFGAYQLAVAKRLHLLFQLEQQGVSFRHLVLLGGKRTRNADKESPEKLFVAKGGLTLRPGWTPPETLPGTEDEIMEMILLQSDLPAHWTTEKDGIKPYTIVDTPLREDRPEKKDPSAEDTLRHWLDKFKPKPGHCLGIYSQPAVRHIELVCKKILGPRGFTSECVGTEDPSGAVNVSKTLDSVAKIIFELTTIVVP